MDALERAAKSSGEMWNKLGVICADFSYEVACAGRMSAALETARIADVCFFMATGEEALTMKDVWPPHLSLTQPS